MSTERPTVTMRPDEWQRVNEIFQAVIECSEDERAAFLEKACTGDDTLRLQVERLLAAHLRAGRFLDGSALPSLAEALAEEDEPSAVGRQVGAYRLVRELGRGGMGAVYLAERADAEYQKQVAVKLIKRGMGTDTVYRHFRTERQILASLDHPNIARLIDGGTTDDGSPYFVMEYVEGRRIDEYCAAHGLGVAERLQLFRQVGAAVSFAHQHLVVHRDLKPSNILVRADGVPKLLDFGIAKILAPVDDHDTLLTATGLRLMTPEYASPEQVQGRPVTTLTDVYSLGVVLYELLTGSGPYGLTSRSLQELAQVICNSEPERPSAARPDRRALRGDLDNIVLMALRKDPSRRYRSVEHLCEDIRRHLAGLPVTARQETFGYRVGKFVRRNRVAVAAAGLVVASLAGGVATTAWQARQAGIQRERAERRFADVRKLARAVLFDYHDAIKDLPGATPVRERLVKDALEYLDSLARESGGDVSLQQELASAYEKVGDVQGGTFSANLGDTAGALQSYRKALALREVVRAAQPRSTSARREMAHTHEKLGLVLGETGDQSGAGAELGRAMAVLEGLVSEEPADEDLRFALAVTCDRAGSVALDGNEVPAALRLHRRALDAYSALAPARRASAQVRREMVMAHHHLAQALVETGDLEQALRQNGEARDGAAALAAEDPLNTDYQRRLGTIEYYRGDFLSRMGRNREALESFRQGVAVAERMLAADPKQNRSALAFALLRVGGVLGRLGRDAEALDIYRRALAIQVEDVKADPASLYKRAALIETHGQVGLTHARLGQPPESVAACVEARALMDRTTVEPDNVMVAAAIAETDRVLGDAYATLAANPRASAGPRPAWWTSAREEYTRALAFWQGVQANGTLGPTDAGKPGELNARIARCDAALAR